MSRLVLVSVIAGIACSLALVAVPAQGASEGSWADARADLELSIKVSPQTINLDGQLDGDCVTVHTDIPYAYVDAATVALNGLPAVATFADSRGNLVAKFSLAAVLELVSPPSTALTLTGITDDGTPFAGSDVIAVFD